ncbi:MAG: protein-tyrosine-phosphatase [Frankiaceae bacterium]|nr:protein-tyrosine-phosphatase [Frankiaceae bacterium]
MSSDVFRVLHVCTGNICRSPLAEHLMRDGLRTRLGDAADRFVVESAGTWGHTGSPMETYALSTLATYALDGSAFSARELVAEHVVAADLILGATREHRAAAVVLHPRAAARTFTLREFARLTAGVDPTALPSGDAVERARALVVAAAANRGLVPPERPRDDDVDDPYQAPASAFATCGALVHATLQGPLDLLGG